ncbi:hypothetical protein AAVH_08846 [Aphelenchoides avenae]|nr:hypothetical protein AAVH_08846 [Aphelenchus avenae]
MRAYSIPFMLSISLFVACIFVPPCIAPPPDARTLANLERASARITRFAREATSGVPIDLFTEHVSRLPNPTDSARVYDPIVRHCFHGTIPYANKKTRHRDGRRLAPQRLVVQYYHKGDFLTNRGPENNGETGTRAWDQGEDYNYPYYIHVHAAYGHPTARRSLFKTLLHESVHVAIAVDHQRDNSDHGLKFMNYKKLLVAKCKMDFIILGSFEDRMSDSHERILDEPIPDDIHDHRKWMAYWEARKYALISSGRD